MPVYRRITAVAQSALRLDGELGELGRERRYKERRQCLAWPHIDGASIAPRRGFAINLRRQGARVDDPIVADARQSVQVCLDGGIELQARMRDLYEKHNLAGGQRCRIAPGWPY